MYALEVLSTLKERGKLAVPDLLNSLAASTNRDERFAILNTLTAIAPLVAENIRTNQMSETR